jgi:hypothetical protein
VVSSEANPPSSEGTDYNELAEDLLAVCNFFVAKNNGKRAAALRRSRQSKGSLKVPKMKTLPDPVKAMKIKLHPRNVRDHKKLKQILGTVRWTYNKCIHYIRQNKVRPTKKDLRALFVNNTSDAVRENPWLLEVGYDIRDDAVKDVITAFKGNMTKMKEKTIDKFQLQFRSKKKQKSETFYLRHRWIVQKTKEHNRSQSFQANAYQTLDKTKCMAWTYFDGFQTPTNLDWRILSLYST